MTHKNSWHTLDAEQIAARLESDPVNGLSRKQAHTRAKKLNIRLPDATKPLFLPEKKPLYQYIARMFLDPVMILTMLVALIAFFFGEYALGGVILGIMICNAIFCAVAYNKAMDVGNTLQLYSNPMIKVVRGGRLYTTDARNVVPGDVVILTSGDICPADVRLEKGSSLRVLQYTHTGKGAKSIIEQVHAQKSGERIYMPDEDIHNPDCENIVYAGSVVEQGYARGMVVETGRHTYIGAVNGTVPGTDHDKEPDSIRYIRRYFVRFATFQAILLLPITLVLTVTMRETLSFAECFLTALSLCCTAIAEHIVALAGIVRATSIDAAASCNQDDAVAIVKNSKAPDLLCEMTDLFLMDSAAFSDGKYHLESVYAGGSICNNRELTNPAVYLLAKDLYLYRSCTRPPDGLDRDYFDVGLGAPIDALIKHMGVDTAEIELTRISSRLRYDADTCTVFNEMKQGDYEVLVTHDEDILQKCTHMLSSDQTKLFDDSEHIALRTLCRIYRESGYRILLVANRKGQNVTLMGVLAFAHRPGYHFRDCIEELINGGVRIAVFMENTSETMKILTDSEFVRDESHDVLTATRAADEGLDLHVAYGSYRAYLGFTQGQIADLIERLKARGNRIASYCVDNQVNSLHAMTDLRITCDAVEYRSAKVAEALYDKMPVDGKPFSSRASQNTRRISDVILRRAGELGGGLHGILTGRKFAFAINHNLANMMTYLITVQLFRVVLVALPAVFGTYTLSAVALLICGLMLDAAAVFLFAFALPNAESVASSYPIMRRLEKPIAYNTANVISACVSALLLWLGMAMLQVFDVLSAAECMGLSFVSTYLMQGTVFMTTLYEYTASEKKSKIPPAMIGAMIGYVLLLMICILVPGLNTLIGVQGMAFITFIMTPFASIVYFAMYRILSAKGLNLHK